MWLIGILLSWNKHPQRDIFRETLRHSTNGTDVRAPCFPRNVPPHAE